MKFDEYHVSQVNVRIFFLITLCNYKYQCKVYFYKLNCRMRVIVPYETESSAYEIMVIKFDHLYGCNDESVTMLEKIESQRNKT